MSSLIQLLRSKGFVAVVLPLSSAVASAADRSPHHSEFTPKQIDDLLASFCASVGRKDGGSGSRAFLIAGSASAAGDAGVEDSAGGMQVYMLSGCAAAGGAAPKSEHFDLFKGNLMITPLRCPGGTPCPNLDGLGGEGTAKIPTEEEKNTFLELQFQLQKKLFAVSARSIHLDIWQHNVEAQASVNAAVKSSVDESRAELEKGNQELIQRSLLFEKQKADDKKVDQVLEMVKELASNAAKASKVEKPEVSNDGGKPSEAGKEKFQTKSNKISCQLFHYSKHKIISYAKSRKPTDHIITIARQIHNSYFVGKKYYPIVFGVIVWYTSGVEVREVLEYAEMKHDGNKAEYKKELVDFRAGKLAKFEALRQKEADALRQREAEALRKQEAQAEAKRKQDAEAKREQDAEAKRKQDAEAGEGKDVAAVKKPWWSYFWK